MKSSPRTKRQRPAASPAAPLLAAPVVGAARHVVLVPGLWDTPWTMRRMHRMLREAGFETTLVSLRPNDGRLGLDALAAQVRDQIEARVPAREKLSIVGFSMGGLVARSYLRQFGDPVRVTTFISISSPHRGTWTAWLLPHEGVRDMRPGSPFLAALDADAARYAGTRWITLRTPLDLTILPADSSSLPWASNAAFPVLLHPLMLWDRRVIRAVIAALPARP